MSFQNFPLPTFFRDFRHPTSYRGYSKTFWRLFSEISPSQGFFDIYAFRSPNHKFLPTSFQFFLLPTTFFETSRYRGFSEFSTYWRHSEDPPADLNSIFFFQPTFEVFTYRRFYEISANRRPLKDLPALCEKSIEKNLSILVWNMSKIE